MKRLSLYIYIVSLAWLMPLGIHAATSALMLDTGNASINAIQATLHLPAGVSIDKVNIGDSAVVIWITPPKFDEATHSISFAGLTPGGFGGVRSLFTFTGDFSQAGIASARVTDVLALQNDGKGTAAQVKFTISKSDVADDKTLPEPFKVLVGKSADAFDGQPFVSFIAQDKQSGVDHYEYAATWFRAPRDNEWQTVANPYLVPQGDSAKVIYIRAVDSAGNSRISSAWGPSRASTLSLWGIIILLIVCVLYYVRRFF